MTAQFDYGRSLIIYIVVANVMYFCITHHISISSLYVIRII